MRTKWKWVIAHLAGFGECVFQVDEQEYFVSMAHRFNARRMTILVPGQKGVQMMRWFPMAPMTNKSTMVSGETVILRRDSVTLEATPSKDVVDNLTEMWSGIITTPQNGNIRRM